MGLGFESAINVKKWAIVFGDSCLVLTTGSQFSEGCLNLWFLWCRTPYFTGRLMLNRTDCVVDSTRRCKEDISYSPPSLETSRHSPRLADIVVQLGEKIISRSVDTNSGVVFLRGKKKTGRCSRTHWLVLFSRRQKWRRGKPGLKLRALLEIIAGKDAMLWEVSPSGRSDQCSTREYDDGGIGDAVPIWSCP